MNVNYVYPEYYYPAYPEYYYGYYEPVKPRNARRSYCPITGAASVNLPQNAISNHSDIDESVKQLIQMSKEQIAKEKEINETKLCGSSNNSAVNVSCSYNNGPCNLNPPISHNETHKSSKNSQSSPVIGETNRLAKHIVEILENIYQTSSFVNRKRREEIAQDLNLPVEKVRNWFQNRRGKDRRQNQVQRINSRKYVRSGKYARKTNDDFVYYDQKISSDSGSMIMDEGCRGAGGGSIVLKTAGVCDLVPESASVVAGINFLAKATEVIACSPEKVKVGKLAYTVESGPNSPGLCSAPQCRTGHPSPHYSAGVRQPCSLAAPQTTATGASCPVLNTMNDVLCPLPLTPLHSDMVSLSPVPSQIMRSSSTIPPTSPTSS